MIATSGEPLVINSENVHSIFSRLKELDRNSEITQIQVPRELLIVECMRRMGINEKEATEFIDNMFFS